MLFFEVKPNKKEVKMQSNFSRNIDPTYFLKTKITPSF